jgi:hypothetical protein
MSAICNAYTCKGTNCTRPLSGEYCKEHTNSLKMIGPMRFRHNQERYIAARKIKTARNKHIDDHTSQTWTAMLVATAELNGLIAQHADERRMGPHALADQQSYDRLFSKLRNRKEIREGLREHDRLMHQLRGDGRDEDMDTRLQRMHYLNMVDRGEMTIGDAYRAFVQRHGAAARAGAGRQVWEDQQGEREYAAFGPPIPNAVDGDNWLAEPPRERTLAEIAADRQNIHTAEVVKKFKDMVELIRKIEVPEEYRWSMTKMSKTMIEIIAECDLTPRAAWQFSSKYCADDTIYEMEEGIFGKLMDAVWQHVKNLEDPASLKQIVKEELEMNIGTCAQGNLTRVANILVGILDGLDPQEESRLEKIGKAINNVRRTLTMAMTRSEIVLATMKALVPFGMTAAEMKPWVDAVADILD